METLTKIQRDGTLAESLKVIVPRIKKNLKEMEKIAERATTNVRTAVGRDLNKAQKIVLGKGGNWYDWLKDNFAMSRMTANRYMSLAKDRSQSTSITEHLRDKNPNYALPRQSVDEQPVRNLLAGIDVEILLEREKSERKEQRIKKLVALELIKAGFRALSLKLHADRGGTDDAMRRLDEVRKALKEAVEDNQINL
jgi:hypothetical protein